MATDHKQQTPARTKTNITAALPSSTSSPNSPKIALATTPGRGNRVGRPRALEGGEKRKERERREKRRREEGRGKKKRDEQMTRDEKGVEKTTKDGLSFR
jgi:hypothetical protein